MVPPRFTLLPYLRTGAIPYLDMAWRCRQDVYQPRGEFLKTKVAFTIHNIAFQGRFWARDWDELSLPDSSRSKFQFTDGYARVRAALPLFMAVFSIREAGRD